MTHPQTGARDEAWIADWLPVAAQLGAQNVRVIAGKTAGEGALERSAAALNSLAERAEALGLKIIIENWFDLLSTPEAVRALLERTQGRIGFLLDFSNWNGAGKYEKLAQIAPFASSCHAQAHFLGANSIDEDDFSRCLGLPYPANFNGPFLMVNGELEGIGVVRDFIRHGFR